MDVLLAHISDLHLDGSERARERVQRVMGHLAGLPRPVDAVLVTGDIADRGLETEYAEAARLFDCGVPVLTCPGNHDSRSAYRTALLGLPAADGPVNAVHRLPGVTVLTCDATIPGRDEGRLGQETLAWIGATLAEGPQDVPALLAFHQPPVTLGHPPLDVDRVADAGALAAIVRAHPRVAASSPGTRTRRRRRSSPAAHSSWRPP